MLWLCLRFPNLPLDALGQSQYSGPLALYDGKRISIVNTAATQHGVETGLAISSALSLCPTLKCIARDSHREQQQLNNIALWAYRFSGDVSLCAPNAIVIELGASLRLFKNLARLYRRFLRVFQQQAIAVEVGIANTPLAAELLSHLNLPISTLVSTAGELNQDALQQALQQFPITRLPLEDKLIQRIGSMGMDSLGQLIALPVAALNRRFGAEFGVFLDRISGAQADLRPLYLPSEEFHSERLFDGGLHNKEQLRFPISALLNDLAHYLRLRQCVNTHLDWNFTYLDGSQHAWAMPLSHRHFNKRNVMELTLLHIEKMILSGPVEGLSLHCGDFISLEQQDNSLFATDFPAHQQQERSAQLLDKLRLRLGSGHCHHTQLQDEHLPELAWTLREASANKAPVTKIAIDNKLLRPNWLCQPPLAIRYHQQRLYWQGELHLLQGPERFDCQWWQQRQTRDYYIARHTDGRLCWLYKNCLSQNWYLHGIFS